MSYAKYDNFKLAIRVVNHCKENPLPTQAHDGEWYDLRSAEDVHLKAGDSRCISFGISVKLPQGYEAHIAPRSSTFNKWGIIQTNGVGIIDNKYCGNDDIWMMPVYATRDTHIRVGDRIAQFRIMLQQHPSYLVREEKLGNSNRGGFGSTGVR